MQLLIDVGNTRIKWMLLSDDCDGFHSIDSVMVSFGLLTDLTNFINELETNDVSVSVAAVNQSTELIALLNSYSFRSVFYAKTTAQHLEVVNSYSLPERMGVDRWLAMIAGYSALKGQEDKKGAIVVDAGSALTIDVVTNDGLHLGGYIVPGLLMAKKALFANTEQVINYDESLSAEVQNDKLLRLGNNTMQCVDYGIINQMIALIQMVVGEHDKYQLVLTGGDGDLLAEYFTKANVDKNLVLKGLWQVSK